MNYRNFSKIWFRNDGFVWQTPPGTPEAPKPPEAAPSAPAAAPSADPAEQARAAEQKAEKAAEKGADAAKKLEQASATPEVSGDKKPDTPHAATEAATAAAALSAAEEAAEEGSGNEEGLIDKLMKLIIQWIDKLMGKKDKKSAEKKETSLLGGATKLEISKKYDETKKEEGIGIKTTKDQQVFTPRGGIIEDFTDDSMKVKTSDGFVITYKGIKPNPNLSKGSRVTAGNVVIGEATGETVTIIAQNSAGAFVDPTPLVQKYLPPEPAAAAATAATTASAEAAPATAAAAPAKPAGKPAEKKEAAPAGQLTISGYIAGVGISIEAAADTDIKLSQEVKVLEVDRNARILKLQLPTYTLQISDFNINPSLKKGATIKPGASLGKIIDKKAAKAVCTTNDKSKADIDPTHFFTGKEQPKIQNPNLEITDYSPARGENTIEIRVKQPDQKLQFGYGAWVEDVNREKGTLTLLVGGGYSVTFENINSSLDKSNQIKPFAEVGTPFDSAKPIIVSCTRELKKTDDKGVPLEKPKEEGGGFVYPKTFIDPTFFFKAPEKKKEEPSNS